MAGDEQLFKEMLGALNLRGIRPYIDDALKIKDPSKRLDTLASYWASFALIGPSVHKAGQQIKDGKVDCLSVEELLRYLGGNIDIRLLEYMDRLADAKDKTLEYFNSKYWDLDDEGLYERYKALARLAAKTVREYQSELLVLDRKAANDFAMRVSVKMLPFGCNRLHPNPAKETYW